MLRAQIHQAREPTDARHGEIQQDEVDLGVLVQLLDEFVEVAAFDDGAAGDGAGDRLMQGPTNQRMIVGNDYPCRLTHAWTSPAGRTSDIRVIGETCDPVSIILLLDRDTRECKSCRLELT